MAARRRALSRKGHRAVRKESRLSGSTIALAQGDTKHPKEEVGAFGVIWRPRRRRGNIGAAAEDKGEVVMLEGVI